MQLEQSSEAILFAESERKRFKLKAGVFLFLIKDEQILLLRRFNTGIDDGKYVVPMGSINGNETLTNAVIREAFEEANIIINPNHISLCHVMHRLHRMPFEVVFEQIDFFFLTHVYEGNIINREPHKCDQLAFFPLDNLPVNTAPFIRAAIESLLQKKYFSEFGWIIKN